MMLIANNRFFVNREFENAFEERWKNRESHLDKMPGFMKFRLLKQKPIAVGPPSRDPQAGEITEYISYSEWLNEEAFLNWASSESSKKTHSSQGPLPTGMLTRPPEFRAYTIEQEQGRGHRTDFRSAHQDLIVETGFSQESPEQKELFRINQEKGLPSINIGAFEGRLIEILLRSSGAKRGIEIGTLGGYSASWIARALPEDGKLISIELDPKRAALAEEHFKRMGLGHKIEVKVGKAVDVLQTLNNEKDLDFVFIDADKSSYGHYTKWALPRLRKGGLLLADNAYLWGGMNYYGHGKKEVPLPPRGRIDTFYANDFEGMSECWSELAHHPEMASIILPTGEGLGVGLKI